MKPACGLVFLHQMLFFGLHEPKTPVEHKRTNPIKKEYLKRLGKGCWWVIGLGAGAIWDTCGAEYTFYAGAVNCLATLVYLCKTPDEAK